MQLKGAAGCWETDKVCNVAGPHNRVLLLWEIFGSLSAYRRPTGDVVVVVVVVVGRRGRVHLLSHRLPDRFLRLFSREQDAAGGIGEAARKGEENDRWRPFLTIARLSTRRRMLRRLRATTTAITKLRNFSKVAPR